MHEDAFFPIRYWPHRYGYALRYGREAPLVIRYLQDTYAEMQNSLASLLNTYKDLPNDYEDALKCYED